MIINELRLNDFRNSTSKTGYYVVMWKDKVFIFDDEISEKQLRIIMDHFKSHPYYIKYSTFIDTYDVHDVYDAIGEMRDIISGILKNNILYLSTVDVSPTTSLQLRKLIKLLKIKKVSITDSESKHSIIIPKSKIKGKFPNIMYHGTTSKVLPNILKNGISPPKHTRVHSSFRGINHYDVIFLHSNLFRSFFYAKNAANIRGGFPIVIELTIPNKDLILPDYDADPNRTTPYYADNLSADDIFTLKPMGMSLHTGKFGYLGIIYPRNIQWIHFRINNNGSVRNRKVRPKTFNKLFNSTKFKIISRKHGEKRLNNLFNSPIKNK